MSGLQTDGRYDVVIVGAGSAGCVLAARLSENPDRRVLILESGPTFTSLAEMPPSLRDERTFPVDHLWTYEGFDYADSADSAPVIRGRALGGSGSANGMIYQRGLPENYDGWGSPLWSAAALDPVFERIEDDRDADPSTSTPGVLPIGRIGREGWAPAHRAFHDALRDLGVAENPDVARTENQGVGATARNGIDGVRVSAALAYLLPALVRPNLELRGHAHVARVVIEGGRARGIEAIVDGQPVRVAASEVIVSAGAIESPHLLALSGIGEAATIRRLGIDAAVDLPGVGQHLHDHPAVTSSVRLKRHVREWDLRCLVACTTTTEADASAGQRSDVSTVVLSGPYAGSNGGGLPDAPDSDHVDVNQMAMLYAPDSVGHLEFVSADPAVQPRIHFRYLEAPRDRERMRAAVRQNAAVFAHPAFAEMIDDWSGTPDTATLDDDAALDAWIRRRQATTLHGCGTCRMGPDRDPEAVVDFHGRVRGVDGLRVADLSIAPRAPTAATNATAMAIGERIAALIDEG
ncbi:MAG: GMC family oxidoreductase N-terminal domain-containing protein [Patulibacter sp.]|nr:GMC family oxidoreductase N-terminal domain-containing protein [Patulibacter sp.]